jgi:biopolymer transport protein TolQ
VSFDLLDLVFEAGPIVQLVLLLLALMSVVSWAIIATKWRELAGAAKDSEAFLDVYHSRSLEECYDAARGLRRGPLAVIFLAVRAELARQVQRGGAERGPVAVRGQLSWAAAKETQRLERGLSFLATTGSSAPFIGLFGTVIGIIQAFQGIAEAGSASLAVVAPGIAEALIATAIGLLAAIPATIFYNLFVGRVDAINASIELFAGELEEDVGRGVKVKARAGEQPAAG